MAVRTISRVVGNQEYVATERHTGWEVEQRTPGPFAAGLTEAQAVDVLDALAKLYRSTLRTKKAPRALCSRIRSARWKAANRERHRKSELERWRAKKAEAAQ